jgi:hypothetical protein
MPLPELRARMKMQTGEVPQIGELFSSYYLDSLLGLPCSKSGRGMNSNNGPRRKEVILMDNPSFSIVPRAMPVSNPMLPALPNWERDYYPQLRDTGEGMVRTGIVLLGTGLFCLFLLSLVGGQRQ